MKIATKNETETAYAAFGARKKRKNFFQKKLDKHLKKVYSIELYQYKMDIMPICGNRGCTGAGVPLRNRKDCKLSVRTALR